jgi:hypothetical protein
VDLSGQRRDVEELLRDIAFPFRPERLDHVASLAMRQIQRLDLMDMAVLQDGREKRVV